MHSHITQEKTIGCVNLARHPSSASTKTIVRENAIKRKKCYYYHKQQTYQQSRMRPCIFVIFAKEKKKKITIWTKTSSKELHSTNSHDIVDITSPMEDTSVENSQQKITSRFERGTYKEPQFVKIFNTVYDKVVFWRKNIFLLSSGKSGK